MNLTLKGLSSEVEKNHIHFESFQSDMIHSEIKPNFSD